VPLKKRQSMIDRWIIEVLITYGNCVIPTRLIESHGTLLLESMLSMSTGMRIKIRKTNTVNACTITKYYDVIVKEEPCYIAEDEDYFRN
jgi:hypothetical protein